MRGRPVRTERIIRKVPVPKSVSTSAVSTAKNVSYIGMSQLLILVLNIVTLTILANLLSMEDMGIISMSLLFLSLLYNLQDFGIMPAVIQRDTRIEDSVSAALLLRWIMSVVLVGAMIVVSPLASDFFGTSELTLPLIVISTNLLILTFGFAPQAMLTRALRFPELAIASSLQYVVMSSVTISLALLGFTYWSFVAGSVLGTGSFVITVCWYERTRFAPKRDAQLTKELLHFGKHLLVTSLMVFLISYIDQMVIAKVLGVAALGIYFIALRFGRTLGEQIAVTMSRVLFPTMARIRHANERLRGSFVESLRMTAIVSVPLCLGIASLAPLIVETVLGDKWLPAVVPMAILSIQGLFASFQPSASGILTAIGKPQYLSRQSMAQATALMIGIYPVANAYGIEGVCVLTTSLSAIVFVYLLTRVSHFVGSKPSALIRPLVPSLASGAVMFAALLTLTSLLPTSAVSLAVLVALGGGIYFGVLNLASGGKDVRDLVSLTKRVLLSKPPQENGSQ